jgi:predicted amidophosphoribosyltransferase
VTLVVRLLRAFADLVLPTPCAGCGQAGERWCAACRARFDHPGIRAVPGLPPVVVLAPYAGPARSTVLAYKERGRRDLAGPLAARVAVALAALGVPRAVVVPAPSRRSAARSRGGDHMVRLARALPGGVPVARALVLRVGARDSVGLDAAARAANLARHLGVRPRAVPPPGTPVVLLDDVLTTGATARAATALLHDAGCRVVAVVVLTAVARRAHRTVRPLAPHAALTRPDEVARPPPCVSGGHSDGRNGGNAPSRTASESLPWPPSLL